MSYPPPPPPPHAQTWAAPSGPPPRRSRTGLTVALLAIGLVLVLGVIGIVALVVRGDDSDGSGGSGDSAGDAGGAHEASCEVYTDVVLSSEIWAATEFDPDKVQEVYDAALADITDDELATLVEEEATVKVSYYRALREWKQAAEDALSRGEHPETTLPAELTAQRTEIQDAQRAVLEECQDTFPDRGNQPVPKVTAPTLISPSVETPDWMKDE